MNAALLDRLRALADARRTLAEEQAALAARQAQFEQETRAIRLAVNQAKDAVAATELTVRTLAVEAHQATGDKKPAPGVTIKEFEILHYDADAAYAWAKQAGVALIPESLDRKAFEAIAKASAQSIAGAYVIVEPRVTIAADLEKALAAADVAEFNQTVTAP